MPKPHTKRTFLKGIATTLAVGASATTVLGQSNKSIECAEVAVEAEYVVFRNTGDSEVDVSGYEVAFEYGNDGTNQRRALPKDTTIEAGGELKVASGYKPVDDADVTFDYDGGVLNDDGNDVVALLDPDGNDVCTTNDQPVSTSTSTETSSSTGDSGGDDTEDSTATDEESTATEEETSTEEPTSTAEEPTSTEEPTATAEQTATEESSTPTADDGESDSTDTATSTPDSSAESGDSETTSSDDDC
ncbi:lamin tail domain-containing protein [Halorarum halophilum]|uniref:Lamin tail domain-containing protein n=1 Tax=Halorarum halophilum TaxID=2743090 RepID=A0A7D5KLA8_9EURY|nr:lamin tail domain-containing protein [Halobaculum halophilum]QLG27375.1 lamin tail domain-containing protein [Halobaculum halophilum]